MAKQRKFSWAWIGIAFFLIGAIAAIIASVNLSLKLHLAIIELIGITTLAIFWSILSLQNMTDKEKLFYLLATAIIIVLFSAFSIMLSEVSGLNERGEYIFTIKELISLNSNFMNGLMRILQFLTFFIALGGLIAIIKARYRK